jgi:hypothetical protein
MRIWERGPFDIGDCAGSHAKCSHQPTFTLIDHDISPNSVVALFIAEAAKCSLHVQDKPDIHGVCSLFHYGNSREAGYICFMFIRLYFAHLDCGNETVTELNFLNCD